MSYKVKKSLHRLLTMGLSLRARIWIGTLLPVLAIGVYFVVGFVGQERLAKTTQEILQDRISQMHRAERIKQDILAYDDALFRYLAIRAPHELTEGQKLRTAVQENIAHLGQGIENSILGERIELLHSESRQYFSDAEKLLEFARKSGIAVGVIHQRSAGWHRRGGSHLELAFLSEEGRTRMHRVFQLCDELITINRLDLERAQTELQDLLKGARRTGAVLSVIAIGILCLVGGGFAISMLYPLGHLMEGVRKVEAGELDVEIPVESSDEIGTLTAAFNRAARTIRQQRDQLWRETITDSLTGVYNQRFFRKILHQEIERARRAHQSFAVLMIDIDHFKRHNDTLGHEFGNEVLKRTCRTIMETLRETDFLARYGGDELAVILPNTTPEHAKVLGDRLVQAVNTAPRSTGTQNRQAKITVSIGGALYPEDAREQDTLLSRADEALYAAKAAGRACIRWAGDALIPGSKNG